MTAPIPLTVLNPLQLDLTTDFLVPNARSPLYAGSLWIQSFRVLDENGNNKDLTGALIVMSVYDSVTTVTRRTDATSSGAPAAQIVIDADQSAEVDYTGKGWFRVRFDAIAADKTLLAPFITDGSKRVLYELAIKFGDATTQVVLCAGQIDVLKPKNTFPLS